MSLPLRFPDLCRVLQSLSSVSSGDWSRRFNIAQEKHPVCNPSSSSGSREPGAGTRRGRDDMIRPRGLRPRGVAGRDAAEELDTGVRQLGPRTAQFLRQLFSQRLQRCMPQLVIASHEHRCRAVELEDALLAIADPRRASSEAVQLHEEGELQRARVLGTRRRPAVPVGPPARAQRHRDRPGSVARSTMSAKIDQHAAVASFRVRIRTRSSRLRRQRARSRRCAGPDTSGTGPARRPGASGATR